MAKNGPKLTETMHQLEVGDSTWVTLGQLRELVAEADKNGWSDSCLVNHGAGSTHSRLVGYRVAHRVMVQGPT